jgi:hypothetical protein
MALDPNIALGVKSLELPNPLAQYGQLAQIQNAQNQNALAQFQLGSARRTEQSQNLLADAYAQSTDPATGKIDYNKLTSLVAGGVGGAQIPGIQKSRLEYETAQTTQQKAQTELVDAKLKQSRGLLEGVTTPDQYIAWHEANHKDAILGPVLAARGITAEQSRARIMEAINKGPAEFQRLINESKLGTEKFMELNKPSTQVVDQSGQRQVLQIPGLGGTPTTVGTYADVPLPANVQAQKIDIARQSRPPAPPAQPSAPVAVVGEDGKIRYVSREEAINKGMTPASAIESLPPKEIQKREAALPQARQSVKTISNTMSVIGQTVDSLLANPDGIDGITGLVYGVTPAITGPARKAKAELEQLKNLAFIQGITELRAASKTGAAVGNVTNREGDRFENLKASLDRSQSKEDLIAALKKLKTQAELTSQFTTEAFDDTYSYKSAAPAAPAAGQGTGGFKYLGKENK